MLGTRKQIGNFINGMLLGAAFTFGGMKALDQSFVSAPNNQAVATQKAEPAAEVKAPVVITNADWEDFVDFGTRAAKGMMNAVRTSMGPEDVEKMQIMVGLYAQGYAPGFVDLRMQEIEDRLDGIQPIGPEDPMYSIFKEDPFFGIKSPNYDQDKHLQELNDRYGLTKDDWEKFINFYDNMLTVTASLALPVEAEKFDEMARLFDLGQAPDFVYQKLGQLDQDNNKQQVTNAAPQRRGLLERMRDNRNLRQQQRAGHTMEPQ